MKHDNSRTGHIHADLMLEYAKDAQETDEPWKLWEIKLEVHDGWGSCVRQLYWNPGAKYRRKIVPLVKYVVVSRDNFVIDSFSDRDNANNYCFCCAHSRVVKMVEDLE